MDRDEIYLKEIKEFAEKIVDFIGGFDYHAFLEDEKTQWSVIKLIENIGEASARLSEKTKRAYPEVDWYSAVAMRNRLVHDYMDVDLAIVYDVAIKEVPALLKHISKLR